MSKQAKYYRQKAQDTLDLARRSVDKQLSDKLREVAEEYHRLAREAEDGPTGDATS